MTPETTYQIPRTGAKVVGDFRRLLQTGDVRKLTPGLYHALSQYGGFIAHYSIHGFRDYFNGDLSALLDGEMRPLTDERCWSEAGSPHLTRSLYRDGMTAQKVMYAISAVARELEADVRYREAKQRRAAHIALGVEIAREYGVTITPDGAEDVS